MPRVWRGPEALQALIAYGLVAGAAGWVVWAMFVPRKLKMRLRGRTKLRP